MAKRSWQVHVFIDSREINLSKEIIEASKPEVAARLALRDAREKDTKGRGNEYKVTVTRLGRVRGKGDKADEAPKEKVKEVHIHKKVFRKA